MDNESKCYAVAEKPRDTTAETPRGFSTVSFVFLACTTASSTTTDELITLSKRAPGICDVMFNDVMPAPIVITSAVRRVRTPRSWRQG